MNRTINFWEGGSFAIIDVKENKVFTKKTSEVIESLIEDMVLCGESLDWLKSGATFNEFKKMYNSRQSNYIICENETSALHRIKKWN